MAHFIVSLTGLFVSIRPGTISYIPELVIVVSYGLPVESCHEN